MTTSEELRKIKDKYQSNKPKVLTPCDNCKQPAGLTVCYHCGLCGREFDKDGNLTKESE